MAEPWRDTNYKYRIPLTVQDANIDSNLTNFPLLLKRTVFTTINTSKVRSDFFDHRIYDRASATWLDYEDSYIDVDGVDANFNIFTRVPTLYSTPSGDQNKLDFYYGYASASDGQDITGTWNADFKGVWHLNEDPSGTAPQMLDSTSNNYDGTCNGSMTSGDQVTGKLRYALDLDGNDDDVTCGHISELSGATKYTLSCWVNITTLEAFKYFLTEWDGADGVFLGMWDADGKVYCTVRDATHDTNNHVRSTNNVLSTSSWIHLTVVFDGGLSDANKVKLYVDGDGVAVTQSSGTPPAQVGTITNTKEFTIGTLTDGASNFIGKIDECRVLNDAMSDAWIKFENRNISLGDNEVTWGAEESNSIAARLVNGGLVNRGLVNTGLAS